MARHLPAEVPVRILTPQIPKQSGISGWRRIRALLRELEPDVLLTYNWGAMDWCLANRFGPVARHVHIEDGFGPEERHRQLPRRALTRRFALRGGCVVVVPSRNLENIALQAWRLPPRGLRYIPNGVDCARFAAVPTARGQTGEVTIGTVATLRREKNLARLIEAFTQVVGQSAVPLKLVIVGDGPERGALEQAAARSPMASAIRFTGSCSAPELELARFDVFALSSDTEQMPLSVLEAMASGLPVVSFAVGDVPHMVAPENSAFASIAPDDEEAFRRALATLAQSSSLRAELGHANQALAFQKFDLAQMLRDYAALLG